LEGWVNSGNVSSGGINYFIRQFKAIKFAEMPVSPYHIYQMPGTLSLSPIFKMEDGIITDSRLPRNQFYYARNPSSEHDLILFSGNEPNLRWEEYADTVVSVASHSGFPLYAFGGLFSKSVYPRTHDDLYLHQPPDQKRNGTIQRPVFQPRRSGYI
jgi:proteasome assembly chaperone (PAC2) family protein